MVNRNNAGGSFESGDIQRKYGRESAAAGRVGEQRFAAILAKAGVTRDYEVWYSLRIPKDPRNPGGTNYNSDVDVAIASGNKLILVDVKNWASGYHYWSIAGLPFKGISPMKKQNGEWKLGANMAGALARYRANLPGMSVEAIVVFIPTNAKGALPSSVGLLRWPGGIKSYLHGSGINKIKSFLGKKERVNPKIESLMSNMSRRR